MYEVRGGGGDSLIDRWDWQEELRQRHVAPIRGTQTTTTPVNTPAPICGRNIDQTVVAGTQNGVPIGPNTVTSLNLAQNPNYNSAPTFQTAPHNQGNTGVFDYIGAGSGAFDAYTAFIIAAPAGNLGIDPPWLDVLRFYKVPHAAAFDPHTNPASAFMDVNARSDGNYSNVRVSGNVAGQSYDVYMAFIDHSGAPSAAVLVGTTASNPLVVQPGNGATVPAGFAWTATGSAPTYSTPGAGTYNAIFNLTLNITNYGSGAPALSTWLDEVIVLAAPTGTSNFAQVNVMPPMSGTTLNNVIAQSLGAGQAWDIKVRLQSFNSSSYTDSAVLFTTAIQTISVPTLGAGPGTAPTISTSSFTSRTIGKGILQIIDFSFTETDFTATPPSWITAIRVGTRENGSGSTVFTGATIEINVSASTTGVYSSHLYVGTANDIDIGVCYIDAQGKPSTITWPAALQGLADANGDFFDSGNSYKTVLHSRHSPGVTGVIDSAGTLDVSKARTSTVLPRANTHSDFTNTVVVGGGIDFTSALHKNKILDNIGDGTTYARVKSTELASGTVTQLNDGTNVVGAAIAAAVTTATLQKNLVLNGNNANGTGSPPPTSYGWKGSWNGGTVGGTSIAQYTINGHSYNALRVTGSGSNPGVYQDIPVVPGQTYTYCVLAWADTVVQPKIFIGNAGFTSQFNATITAPLGNMGAYYTASGVTQTLSQAGAAGTNWTVLYGTFTVPNGNSIARVLLQGIGATTSSSAVFSGVQIIQGNRLQDYIDHEPNPSYLSSSSVMNQQGSLLNTKGNPGWSYSAPSSTSTTLTIASATFTLTDGSTITPAAFSYTFTGLTNGGTYYIDISLDVQNVRYLVNGQPQGSVVLGGNGVQRTTTQQFTDCYIDGVVPLDVNTHFTQLTSGSGTGGSGSGSGGSGSCPAIWQQVRTKERGLIRADEVDLGDHLPTFNGGWCEVIGLCKKSAPIWRYTVTDGRIEESFDVNDTHAVRSAESGKWIIVRDLRNGDRLVGVNGDLVVSDVHYIEEGHYIAIEVVGHEYLLGDCLMHNPTTF